MGDQDQSKLDYFLCGRPHKVVACPQRSKLTTLLKDEGPSIQERQDIEDDVFSLYNTR